MLFFWFIIIATLQQAQDIAINQLASIYNSIYTKLEELLNVKVEQGNNNSVSVI